MKIFQILTLILIFSLFLFSFPAFSQWQTIDPSKPKSLLPPINLDWWIINESPENYFGLINNFRALYPHIFINVRKFRPEEYKRILLEAWAEDRGPDIFSLPNTWLREYQKYIFPQPSSVKIKKQITTGPSCARKQKIVTKDEVLLNLKDLKEKFVSQVEKDVILEGRIVALPLSLDTLVLFYNRDLLDLAKIAEPPKTWEEFTEAVKKLTLIDKENNILQAGAALGTTENIVRPTDILSLLMMQIGTVMTNPRGFATFHQPLASDPTYFPAEEALRFYTDFANKDKDFYTWHQEMPPAFDLFLQGRLAFFFGYSYHLPLIRAQAPHLNFGLSKIPQPADVLKEVNFANYLTETVSRKSQHPEMAWLFLNYAALNPQSFLMKAKRPTALRALIGEQLKDFDLEVFAHQVLTAKSWYLGRNPALMEESFKEMVENINQGKKGYREAINYAVQKINQTIR